MQLRIDLHTHTNHSTDGFSSPEQLVRAAAAAGIDVLGVTDHNTLRGGLEARAAARALGLRLLVIPGIELRTRAGDVLVYGVPHDLPIDRSLLEVIAAVRAHKGWLIAPHPFDRARRGLGAHLRAHRAAFTAIEAFNARCYRRSANRAALAFVQAHGSAAIAVSDAHHARELGRAHTIVNAHARAPAAVFAALASAELACASLSHWQHARATVTKPFRASRAAI